MSEPEPKTERKPRLPDRCPKCGNPLERWTDECALCTLGLTPNTGWRWQRRGLVVMAILFLLALCSRGH
jgi:hypothetical protein